MAKIQRLDTNIVNMSAEWLDLWLGKFIKRNRAKVSRDNTLEYGVLSSCVFNNSTIKIWQLKLWNDYIILPLSGCVFNNCYVLLILKALSPSHTGQDNDTIPKKSFAVTLRIVPCSVTANMNLIDERFFWYRYRVQCDRGLKL